MADFRTRGNQVCPESIDELISEIKRYTVQLAVRIDEAWDEGNASVSHVQLAQVNTIGNQLLRMADPINITPSQVPGKYF